ncbi:MAG: hypothetical protein ACRC9Q_00945 [Bacteroidales bacterium]
MRFLSILITLIGFMVNSGSIKAEGKDAEADNENMKWEFYASLEQTSSKELIQQFEAMYVQKEEVVPGDPNKRTVIRKPDLYYTTRSLDKYLKKAAKKGEYTSTECEKLRAHLFQVALAAIDSETESFESNLRKYKKDQPHQLMLFQRVSLKSVY